MPLKPFRPDQLLFALVLAVVILLVIAFRNWGVG